MFCLSLLLAPPAAEANALSDGFIALFRGLGNLISRLFGGDGSSSGNRQPPASQGGAGHGPLLNAGTEGWYDDNPDYGIQLPLPATSAVLGPQPSGRTPTAPGVVQVFLPADRCKAGVMYFGDLVCPVLGRGVIGRSHASSEIAYGKTNDGRTCQYVKSQFTEGSTPVGDYKLTLRAEQDDKWKRWGGGTNFRMLPKPGQRGFPYHRSGFVVHSDKNTGSNMDYRPTAGCIKLDRACQDAFAKYVLSYKNVEMQVRETQ